MRNTKQNRYIARLIVGAMSIDGSLDKKEHSKVAQTLEKAGMAELVADVGQALGEVNGTFNMYQECNDLLTSLGADANELAPIIFRLITEIVASDRYVSVQEATYLSSMARRLNLSTEQAKLIFTEVMAERRGRLEAAGSNIHQEISPHLKELLSFKGADKLVGELDSDALEELMLSATEAMNEGINISMDELTRALTILGLGNNAKKEDAETVWRESIETLNLSKMADMGETFVSAALHRITQINDAYKTIINFYEQVTP